MVLTAQPRDPLLDLDPWVGQRSASFKFRRVNGVTGEVLTDLTPLRSGSLTHDTTRIIKRQLTIPLGVVDTAAVDTITDRIDLYMVFPDGTEYPMGRYMFTDSSRQRFTSGVLASMVLSDEMFLVDQQIERGISSNGDSVTSVILDILDPLPVKVEAEATVFSSGESWSIGTYRGQMLEALSVSGDYFSPWFGNDRKMHFIRTFDPTTRIPDFDFDDGYKVFREGIIETDDLLTAPNKFVVTSNVGLSTEVVGRASVPPTAPHSERNRGFAITQHQSMQLLSQQQADAVALGLMTRQTVFERVILATVPDPRHDSYNVIHWRGDLWLELAWSMSLVEGGMMNHLLRKAYRP